MKVPWTEHKTNEEILQMVATERRSSSFPFYIIPCYHISDDPSIWLPPGAILVLQQNRPYMVTLDLDLEHIVDADRPGEHCVQVL